MVDREELEVEGPDLAPFPFAHLDQLGALTVLLCLRRKQGQREPRAVDRHVGTQTKEERHRADVVLVTVRQHQRVNLGEPVFDRPEVRQDQVDTGLVVLREQHPAVDDQEPAVELEDGHVTADPTDAAQRDYTQATFRQRGWGIGRAGAC